MIPILLDDFIAFLVVLVLCFASAFLGELFGCLLRHRFYPRRFARAVSRGTLFGISAFVLMGLATIVVSGRDAVGGGLVYLWTTTSNMNQGALHLAASRIVSLIFLVTPMTIAFVVATTLICVVRVTDASRDLPSRHTRIRWSLRQFLSLILALSLLLAFWTAARYESIVYEQAKVSAEKK